jgi:hypothetical protein
MQKRSIFIVQFRPEPGVDEIKALRGVLKIALRRFGLKAVDICEVREERDEQAGQANVGQRDRCREAVVAKPATTDG